MIDRLDLEAASRVSIKHVFDVQGIHFNYVKELYLKDFIIWWPGALLHFQKKVHQPKVAVLVRLIDNKTGQLGKFFRISCNVTDLPLMPVGYVFRLSIEGSLERHKRSVLLEKKLDVNFSPEGWDFYQIGVKDELGIARHYGIKDYGEDYFKKAWMIRFKLANGWSLVIPCIELFSKTYGHSSVIKRNLMTYDIETFEKRVFTKFSLPLTSDGKRQIHPSRTIIKADYQFLSAYQYDVNTTRKIVKRLVAERLAFFSEPTYFPRVKPWHESEAILKTRCHVIDSTKTIIGLDIIGHSYPESPAIVDLRPIQEKRKAEEDDESSPRPSSGHQVLQQPRLEVDFNQNETPDKSLNVTTIKVGIMEHYNRANVIRSTIREYDGETDPKTTSINEVDSVSNDVADGTDKGVGKSNIYAEDGAQNPGTVLAFWDSLCAIQKEQSKSVKSVESYTIENGFISMPLPRLQSLKAKILPKDKRGWFYLKERDKPRGMLIARFTDKNEKKLYWISIQRRTIVKDNLEVETESYGGLVFKLKKGKKIKKVVKKLQREFKKNNARRLSPDFLNGLTESVKSFKHRVNRDSGDPVKYRSCIEAHIKEYF